MRWFFILSLIAVFSMGCARVRVEAPKDPIKLDISMRLDIYQHVEKDINAIEDIVSGTKDNIKPADNQTFLQEFFISNAYAQDGLSPEVEQAALRRKDRHSELVSMESQGMIGENGKGLVEIRGVSVPALEGLVDSENRDRMVIYNEVARKNNISVEEVQKLYVKRLQQDALQGTPIEVLNEAAGGFEWKIKE